jgi:hypothetical protein
MMFYGSESNSHDLVNDPLLKRIQTGDISVKYELQNAGHFGSVKILFTKPSSSWKKVITMRIADDELKNTGL